MTNKRYRFTARVERTVLDTVSVIASAEDQQQAFAKAKDAVLGKGNESVPYCYIENRDTVEVSLKEIKREKF